ncbi:hypothetical protein P7H75_02230 [Vagococcus carniphilus]|uniref:hypothetical protein n=1 Tax=Vagococcus carniphilus TaxID=218144 RepID=UPI00288D0614|nr:hypothetical protein [Vagococcus carniphilus]MDT2813651.1 hypothetical protein [Vagococcus carniphilus]
MEKKRIKTNSWLLVFYLYLHSILVPFNYFLNENRLANLEMLMLISLSIYVLLINREIIKVKMLVLYFFLLSFFLLNVLIVEYKQYVYPVIVMMVISSFLPVFLLGTRKINFEYILSYWFKMARFLSYFYVPILFLLRSNKIIGYFEVAQFVHLNSIILFYYLIVKEKKDIFTVLLLILNFLMLLTMGSRMVLIATVTTFAVIILFLNRKNRRSYFLYSGLFCGIGLIAFLYVEDILVFILGVLSKHGIPSRNILLLLQYVQGTEIKELSSGRDYIYPIAKELVSKGQGLPQGLGVIRNATSGQYYHAHNIFFEMTITFGFIFFALFITWWIFKTYLLYKYNKKNAVFSFFIIISIPYFIRALVGTYFLTDSFFLVAFSILFWLERKEVT